MTRINNFLISLALTTGCVFAKDGQAPAPIPPLSLPGSLGEVIAGLEVGISRTSGDHFNNTTGTKATYVKIGDHYGAFSEFQYEIDSSRVYVGVGASASVTNSKKSVSFDGGSFSMKRLRTATPGVAVGKMVNPKLKVYGTLAYDFSTYEVSYDISGAQPAIKQKLQGPAFGGGVFYKVSGNIIVGIDYKYVMFRKQDIRKTSPLTALKPVENRIVGRVAYNFSF